MLTENLKERQDQYTLYLLSEQRRSSATKAGAVYDEETRYSFQYFLEQEDLTPLLLFEEVSPNILFDGGVLSVDDSVEDKHFSKIGKAHYIGRFWSGRHKRVVVGIDILTLFYTDVKGSRFPVNYRIVDKTEKNKDGTQKTKNDYFQEMVEEVLNWGLKPRVVSGDSWFASEDNMKFLIKRKIGFLFSLKSNRLASDETKTYKTISEYSIDSDGSILHLRNVGFVKVFKKNDLLYAYHDGSTDDKRNKEHLEDITRKEFEEIHSSHWHIEEYHRALKQLCNTDKHYFRNKNTIHSHIHCSLRAFCILEVSRIKGVLKNWYSFITESIALHIRQITQKTHIQDMVLVMS